MISLPIFEYQVKLFETNLESVNRLTCQLKKDLGLDEGEINTIRGKKDKVAVGLRYHSNLISRIEKTGLKLSYQLEKMINNSDFYYTNLSCSFLPDNECKFESARLEIQLSVRSDSGEVSSIKPIVYDLYPDEINSYIKTKTEIGFTTEGKFIPTIIDINVNGQISKSKEYVLK